MILKMNFNFNFNFKDSLCRRTRQSASAQLRAIAITRMNNASERFPLARKGQELELKDLIDE